MSWATGPFSSTGCHLLLPASPSLLTPSVARAQGWGLGRQGGQSEGESSNLGKGLSRAERFTPNTPSLPVTISLQITPWVLEDKEKVGAPDKAVSSQDSTLPPELTLASLQQCTRTAPHHTPSPAEGDDRPKLYNPHWPSDHPELYTPLPAKGDDHPELACFVHLDHRCPQLPLVSSRQEPLGVCGDGNNVPEA